MKQSIIVVAMLVLSTAAPATRSLAASAAR